MTQPITALRDAYAGQTCYVVAKGPSLLNLTADHFPEPGPVVTLNQALRKVQTLGLPHPLLSMQKDGPYPIVCDAPCADCTQMGPKDMMIPEPGALLLVSKAGAEHCFLDYRPRYLFDTERDFGLLWSMPSVVVAIRLAEMLGCTTLVMIAHDIITSGERRSCADGLATVTLAADGGRSYVDFPKLVAGLLAVSRIRAVEWVTP